MLKIEAINPYTIHFSSHLETNLVSAIKQHSQVALIVDDNIYTRLDSYNIYQLQKQLSIAIIPIKACEQNKTRETKQLLEDKLLELGFTRDCLLIAFGGGITLDIVGFLAATYCRGVAYISLPSTLLAMVDVVVGGKTGVNTPHGKNLIGVFNTPKSAWIDTHCLSTLPDVEWQNGISEMIKHALVSSAVLFQKLYDLSLTDLQHNPSLLKDLIFKNCQIKADIVAQDAFDKSIREILNFGHTIGHAIEHASDYQIPHGIAVAHGMFIESYYAKLLGILSDQSFARIITILNHYKLPQQLPKEILASDILAAIKKDKKVRNQQIRMVLLQDIGQVFVENNQYAHCISEQKLAQALDACYEQNCSA